MPPDTQADGPGGPKARRTRGPASPGQRTAQPFGGTLNASPPALCAGGIGLPRAFGDPRRPPHTRGIGPRSPRRRSAASRRTPHTQGIGPPRTFGGQAGVPQPPAAHAGHRSSQPPQASCRPRHTRGIGLPQAFRGPRRSPHTRDLGPRRPPQAFRDPRGPPPTRGLASRPPASRPHPPAARFSRKPPCGIGPRMVYCT